MKRYRACSTPHQSPASFEPSETGALVFYEDAQQAIKDAVEKARAEERERCIQACEAEKKYRMDKHQLELADGVQDCIGILRDLE